MQNKTNALQLSAYGIDRGLQTVAALRVKACGTGSAPRNKAGRVGGRRGKIGRYTPASQARFREAILAVEPFLRPFRRGNRRHFPASFLTLTYPGAWDDDPREWKHHLDLWLQRLKRRHKRAWAIWALEFQARKAPHFHLIVHWDGSGPRETWKERQQWISSSWAAVVAGGEAPSDHCAAGTRARPLKSVAMARNYIIKRQSKDVVVPVGFGRWWGIHNREAYKQVAVVVRVLIPQQLTADVLAAIIEYWRRYWRLPDDVETYKLPRWVSGRAANDVLHAAQARTAVFDAVWVDPRTGEAVADNDNEYPPGPVDVPSEGGAGSGPGPGMGAATPEAAPPYENPPPVCCEECGRLQTHLKDGLCWVCEDPQGPPARTGAAVPRLLPGGNSPTLLDRSPEQADRPGQNPAQAVPPWACCYPE